MSFKRCPKSKWVMALDRVLEKTIDEVPEGWLTASQVAKEMNLSPEQAGKAITIMKKSGAIEMRRFRTKTCGKTGMVRMTCHYRLTNKISSDQKTILMAVAPYKS